ARPSLLTSINQTLEGKTAVAPRVVFKEEGENKKLLLQTKKDKSEGKLKKGKDKPTKGSKEKLNEDPKQKNALERAEDMSPGKRTPSCDLRVFNALEKARRKPISQQNNLSRSYSTLPSGDLTSPTQSPTSSLPELPPIDYEDRLRNTSPILTQMNGLDHASPVLDDITEGPDTIPEMLVVPPPPPRKFLSDPYSLNATPEKPERPPSVDLSHFPPPQLDNTEIPPPPQFSETCGPDIPVFDDLGSEAHTRELPVPDWASGECTHLDSPDGQLLPDHFSISFAPRVRHRLQDQDYNGISENTDTVSEDASKSKKKVKTEDPYVETPQESITGQEETLYQATVMVTAKGRKHDLPVKTGDHISIIRTTNCPKGKWLARDGSNNYGYVSVEHVELDIKEMLELGKKAANTHKSTNSTTEMNSAGLN
ncbi:unnamed protein product, partial [Tetraodon nigroviridis]